MRVRKGSVYIYSPSAWDIFDARTALVPGERVRVVHPHGCPPPNTLRHAHVERESTGEFMGLVCTASLYTVFE